jgi:hypothetical protein
MFGFFVVLRPADGKVRASLPRLLRFLNEGIVWVGNWLAHGGHGGKMNQLSIGD